MEQKANHMNLKGMPMTILRDSLFIYLIDKTNYSIPCVRELETDESYSGKNHRIDYLLLRQNNDFPILHRNFWNFATSSITKVKDTTVLCPRLLIVLLIVNFKINAHTCQ